MASNTSTVFAEDEIGRKWDRCLADALFKLGGGIFLGGAFSLLFFKRRRWPIMVGAGFALGMAYSNCEKDLNSFMSKKNEPPKRECADERKKKK